MKQRIVKPHALKQCLWVICFLVFGIMDAFAQAGGEVTEAKVTHSVSSVGAEMPTDEVELRLRVVDERGHEFSESQKLNETDAKHWLADGQERKLLLIDFYIPMFQILDA